MRLKQLAPVLIFSLSFLYILSPAKAVSLEYYGIDDSINPDMSVHNMITLIFESPITHLDYNLDFKIHNLTATARGFGPVDCETFHEADISRISCDIVGMTDEKKTLILRFDVKDGIKKTGSKYQFISNYGISLPVKRSVTTIELPQNAILAEEPANRSYFPMNGKTLTDGRTILILWEKENLTAGDDLQFSVLYTMPGTREPLYNYLIMVLTLVVIFVMIGIAIYVRKPSKTKTEEEVITSVLNKDEKTIVNLLNKHEGRAGQKYLVRESYFSKAKVSRLIKNLKERGIVEVEPVSGRENRIILRIKSESKKNSPGAKS